MEQIRKEAIQFLSQMAERRMDNTIPIDQLQQYTAIVKHVSGVSTIAPFEAIQTRLKYIKLYAFDDFPALQGEIQGLLTIDKSIKETK